MEDHILKLEIVSGLEYPEAKKLMITLNEINMIYVCGLDILVHIYCNVSAMGHLSIEDLRSLSSRGIPIFNALSEVLEIKISSVIKCVKNGAIHFDHFNVAIKKCAELKETVK